MKIYKVKDRQTLMDIALMVGGGLECLMDLVFANEKSATDELTSKEEFRLEQVGMVNREIVSRYDLLDIVPATGLTLDSLPEGIEYWMVEFDFMVS